MNRHSEIMKAAAPWAAVSILNWRIDQGSDAGHLVRHNE